MDLKSKILAYCSLPFLVTLVAVIQLYNTETYEISRWKGGGFGMYTTINDAYNIIVVNDKILSEKDNSVEKNNFIFNPNEKNTRKYIEHLEKTTEVKKLQVFKPVFDPETNQLTYKIRYEKIIE